MPLAGYPDFARVQLATGYLLAGGEQAFTGNVEVFKGYVGFYPYINFFWNAVGGSVNDQITLVYYSDDTFTQQVASQIGIRNTNCIGYRQYAVLSPWVIIQITPSAAGDPTMCTYALYGSTQQATSAKLGSLDNAYLESFNTIPASDTITVPIVKVYPGAAILNWVTASAVWNWQLQRLDYGSGLYKTTVFQGSGGSPASGNMEIALPDAPVQLLLTNGDAAPKAFDIFATPIMD